MLHAGCTQFLYFLSEEIFSHNIMKINFCLSVTKLYVRNLRLWWFQVPKRYEYWISRRNSHETWLNDKPWFIMFIVVYITSFNVKGNLMFRGLNSNNVVILFPNIKSPSSPSLHHLGSQLPWRALRLKTKQCQRCPLLLHPRQRQVLGGSIWFNMVQSWSFSKFCLSIVFHNPRHEIHDCAHLFCVSFYFANVQCLNHVNIRHRSWHKIPHVLHLQIEIHILRHVWCLDMVQYDSTWFNIWLNHVQSCWISLNLKLLYMDMMKWGFIVDKFY